MDGVDTTWARFPGGAEVAKLADEAVAKFDAKDPAASVPGLLAIRGRLASLPADPLVAEKRRQLDRAIQGCLGLVVETTVPRAEVVPGEVLHLRHSATVAAGVPVRWLSVSYPLTGRSVDQPIDLTAGRPATRDVDQTLPADAPLGQPYWLREEHSVGLFKVNPALIGQPENPTAFPVEHRFQVGGQTLEIADVPVQAAEQGQPARRLDVIAPVALRPLSEVRLFAPGAERPVDVEVTAARDGAAGTLDLRAPDGWTVTPRVAAVPAGDGRRPCAVVVHRQGPVRIGYGRHHGRGPRGRPDLELRSGRDPARAYPRAVAPAPRAAQGLDPRPRDQGPSRRLHPRRRRQRGRGPRGDGLRGHTARRRGPDSREARRPRRRGDRRPRLSTCATTSPPTCRRSSPTSRAAGRSSPSTTARTGSRRTGSPPTTCGCPTPASPTRTHR